MKKPLFTLSIRMPLGWVSNNLCLREADWNSLAGIYHRYIHIYPAASRGLAIFIKSKEGRLLRRIGIKAPEPK